MAISAALTLEVARPSSHRSCTHHLALITRSAPGTHHALGYHILAKSENSIAFNRFPFGCRSPF